MLRKQQNFYLSGLAGALVIVAGFNLLVDPFWLYDVVNKRGFNREKVTLHNYLYVHKAHAVYRKQPNHIILGASGAGVGLNPDHPGWTDGVTYNAGLPGAGIREMRLYFEHHHASRPVKQIVIALDLSSFNVNRAVKPGFSEERLTVSPWFGAWSTRVHDLVPTLLSASAFNQSVYNLRRNLIVTNETFTRFLDNGQAEWSYHRTLVPQNGGPSRLMQGVEENFVANVWFPPPRRTFEFESGGYSTFSEYESFLETAYRDSVDTFIVINPSHARLMEALDAAGLWRTSETWKRNLVQINEEIAGKYGRPAFPVWDFAGYNSLTTEEVPDDREALMQWFWESVHYRPELGDVMLDRVFGYRSLERPLPEDFGVQIDSRTIESVLAGIRQSQSKYRSTHPAYFRSISAFAHDAEAKRLASRSRLDRLRQAARSTRSN